MPFDFKLTNTLSRTNNVDLDDVLKAKSTFKDLGYYRTPRYGMTSYPDEPLFTGIEEFQKDQGLTVDGVMNPGGPTARRLGEVLDFGARPTIAGRNPPPRRTTDYRIDHDGRQVIRTLPHDPEHDGPSDPTGAIHLKSAAQPVGSRTAANSPSPQTPATAPPQATRSAFIDPPRKPQAPARAASTTSRPSPATVPPVPHNKRHWFNTPQRQKEWRDFHAATQAQPNLSQTERSAFMDIFGQEGGMQRAPQGTAAAGVLQSTLDRLSNRGYLQNVAPGTPPDQLSPGQVSSAYKAYFDDVLRTTGGSVALGQITDRKAASAFADTMFRHGREKGAGLLQNAINATQSGAVIADRKMGPNTFRAFRSLAANPSTRDRLLDALADQRTNAEPNEKTRFDNFRP